ncbi:hypothetical protein FEM48_Zijuj06G0159900 [Ziziphus jujuba var. spinosa]|uniref:Symplekin C-terminal domain-containing protein n=1 Tax=Ziziphus jujuba var. spinosa TaxID=714518 RepID=A0A978VA87_ZIZJJ|nr:hypothetical protein FEM48_Zijuj06G0159900 [Ziziphus jujuba var. spinosa]
MKAGIDANDVVVMLLQNHIIMDYHEQKGHELVLHVLFHLHSLTISDPVQNTYPAVVYEKFLLAVTKSLLDSFPASDKSFSKLLGEVPILPDSILRLLDDLCYSNVTDQHGKSIRDVERVTQGLGAVWSLILGRPQYRQDLLDIALKCAVHTQDEIRAKAIRLVANKLFQLSYISENIEQFATNMLQSVHRGVSDVEHLQYGSTEQRAEGEVGNGDQGSENPLEETSLMDPLIPGVGSQETSVSGSQISESGNSENNSTIQAHLVSQSSTTMSLPEVQRAISLYFALCTKKPNLLQLVFNIYGQSTKTVKQAKWAFHRHIPILIRALGSSYSELLHIISDPPQGSENLLALVLQILTQETTPSSELIATVKHLYETKLKDVSILIPMLSSLSKNEVLPIIPRLVGLPLDKFQMALARILQGSAHTGPALTPAEVLVAIHGIVPERDGVALKKACFISRHFVEQSIENTKSTFSFLQYTSKWLLSCCSMLPASTLSQPWLWIFLEHEITEACSACFEQRTVFTQQVLAKALSQMIDQTPLPLLFMRTVIQAIDAFPSLVDFVMEILSKLVRKQVWRLPKLWVGFLKCVSQTQPHSFNVLLQLPPPQLESAVGKHPNLKVALANFASQPSVKASLPRSILSILGLTNEMHAQQSHLSSSFHPSDTSSSVQGTTQT